MADSNSLKGQYFISIVKEVFPDKQGRVRKGSIEYKGFRTGDKVHKYMGGNSIVTPCSGQRPALLVAVDSP